MSACRATAALAATSSMLRLKASPVGEKPNGDSMTSAPDDTLQIVEYFNAVGQQKAYGYQPVPVMTDETRKSYQLGYQLLFPADAKANPGGVSCTKRISSLTVWSWSALKPTCS